MITIGNNEDRNGTLLDCATILKICFGSTAAATARSSIRSLGDKLALGSDETETVSHAALEALSLARYLSPSILRGCYRGRGIWSKSDW